MQRSLFSLLLFLYVSSSLAFDCSPLERTITVDQSGGGDSTTVQAAIDSIPENSNQWIKIHVRSGKYKEKVMIPKEKGCIFLEGEGRENTIISWDDHMKTATTPTFTVMSENFVAKSISFENSYNLEEYRAQGLLHSKLNDSIDVVGTPTPAIAVFLVGDKQAFYQCGFLGYQDTICDNVGRHYFKECYIEGAVDFIFGNGQSFYENCDIHVTGRGYIAAQGRENAEESSGYVFESCHVYGTGQTYLGRAYRAFSRVIYHSCAMDVDVAPDGWGIWDQAGHEGDITFVESDCRGTQYDTSRRIDWLKTLNADQLAPFARDAFVNQDGWIEKQPM